MTTLSAYTQIFEHRVQHQRPTAAEAARAMFTLNRQIKPEAGGVRFQATVYPLKAALIEALWRGGMAYRVAYEPWTTPKPTYSFSLAVDGVLYRWHLIEEDVDWDPACCDLPPPPGLREPVGLDNRSVGERVETIQRYLRVNGRTR